MIHSGRPDGVTKSEGDRGAKSTSQPRKQPPNKSSKPALSVKESPPHIPTQSTIGGDTPTKIDHPDINSPTTNTPLHSTNTPLHSTNTNKSNGYLSPASSDDSIPDHSFLPVSKPLSNDYESPSDSEFLPSSSSKPIVQAVESFSSISGTHKAVSSSTLRKHAIPSNPSKVTSTPTSIPRVPQHIATLHVPTTTPVKPIVLSQTFSEPSDSEFMMPSSPSPSIRGRHISIPSSTNQPFVNPTLSTSSSTTFVNPTRLRPISSPPLDEEFINPSCSPPSPLDEEFMAPSSSRNKPSSSNKGRFAAFSLPEPKSTRKPSTSACFFEDDTEDIEEVKESQFGSQFAGGRWTQASFPSSQVGGGANKGDNPVIGGKRSSNLVIRGKTGRNPVQEEERGGISSREQGTSSMNTSQANIISTSRLDSSNNTRRDVPSSTRHPAINVPSGPPKRSSIKPPKTKPNIEPKSSPNEVKMRVQLQQRTHTAASQSRHCELCYEATKNTMLIQCSRCQVIAHPQCFSLPSNTSRAGWVCGVCKMPSTSQNVRKKSKYSRRKKR